MIRRSKTAILAVFAAVCVAFFGVPAMATPPTIITVEDRIFGLSESELFVLRITQDNLGSHFANRTETFLIAVDLSHGGETYWHVDSVQVSTVFGEGGEEDRKQMIRNGSAGLVNPFAILAERGGAVWAAASSAVQSRPRSTVDVTRDTITIAGSDMPAITMDKSALVNQMGGSLYALQFQMPNYSRMETLSTREHIALLGFAPETCKFTDGGRSVSPMHFKPVQLVRAACTDAGDMNSVSLLLVAAGNPGP